MGGYTFTPPTDPIQQPKGPDQLGGSFLSGYYGVMGPHIVQQEEEARAQKMAQMKFYLDQLHSGAFATDPNDQSPEAAEKRRQYQHVQDQVTKLTPKSTKNIVQMMAPLLHLVHHGQPPPAQGAGGTGGQTAPASAPAGAGAGAVPPPPMAQAQNPLETPPVANVPPPPMAGEAAAAKPAVSPADLSATQMDYSIAQQGKLKGTETEAELGGQIKAREELLKEHPELANNPMAMSMMMTGRPMMGLLRTGASGGGLAGDLRSQGYEVPQDIPDNQWVNMKETLSGQRTFAPGAPPAGQYSVNPEGKTVPKVEATMEKEQRDLGIWQLKNRVQYGQRLAVQQQSLQNALNKGAFDQALKIVDQGKVDYFTAQKRAAVMDKNLRDIAQAQAQGKTDQQAMVSLLGNHILMTTGAGEKGASRATKAMWDEARKSQPLLARVEASFDNNGYLSGVTLSPDQMQFMVNLAHERMGVLQDNVSNLQQSFSSDLSQRHNMTPPPKAGAASQGGTSGRRIIDLTH